jgi:peptidoglycan L-alanyl-D-glutamate endopeptidase CwlK
MKKYKEVIIGASIGLTVLSVAWYLTFKSVTKALEGKVWDSVSDDRINGLHPSIRDRVRSFINDAASQGVFLRVTSGKRSWIEQQVLYNQGRTTPGDIVTNAEPGESTHNYGLGFDVVEMINGQPQWNGRWDKIGVIGKKHGFDWGGDWISIDDKPHFSDTFGYSIASLRTKYLNGQFENGHIALA